MYIYLGYKDTISHWGSLVAPYAPQEEEQRLAICEREVGKLTKTCVTSARDSIHGTNKRSETKYS